MSRTLVVDGSNILMRSIKAAEGRMHLSVDHEGIEVNTGPLLLFVNLISKYVRQVRPDRAVVCWDGGRSSRRTAIYADYKAARNDAGEERDLTPFAMAKEFLSLAGFHLMEMPGEEADDLVAAYWHRRTAEHPVTIVSGDKDFLQLLGPLADQIRPGGSGATPESERWTHDRVVEEMGCRPEHIPSLMALTGDSGDGVPGIPGFGAKTACKFLAKYDWSLSALLAAGEARLDGQEEAVLRNYALVDLRTPVPGVEVDDLPDFTPTAPSSLLYDDLGRWLDSLGMQSVRDRLATHTLWR